MDEQRRSSVIFFFVFWAMLASTDFVCCAEVSSQIVFGSQENVKTSIIKKRNHFVQDDPTKYPTVINNVQIVVNGNGSQSGMDKCKNGICNVSVSSRRDDEGNIVTDIHLNIITKLETNLETNSIPVMDGVRGVGNTFDNSFDFFRPNRSQSSTYLYNNIPQIQSRYQGGEPLYQNHRRIYQRPLIRPVVDDKIEPPFTET